MSKNVNVHITIDAAALVAATPDPSQDSSSPTMVGHNYFYMVVTDGSAISGNGTGDLNFSANVGDVVRFSSATSSNNYEDAVLIYGIAPFGSGTVVVDNLLGLTYPSTDVYPSGPAVLPAETAARTFTFFQGDVSSVGTEQYSVHFALYTRTGRQLSLYGYFGWDPTITVAS